MVPDAAPPQLRLSTGTGLRNSNSGSQHLHESPLVEATDTVIAPLSARNSPAPRITAFAIKREDRTQPDSLLSPGCDTLPKATLNTHADKENQLMGLCVSRFNMLEVCLCVDTCLLLSRQGLTRLTLQRALVLALDGKLNKEAYKFKVCKAAWPKAILSLYCVSTKTHPMLLVQVSDLLTWTTTVLNTNKIRGCTEQELLAVLQLRDTEESIMLSARDGTDLVYIM